MFLVEIYKAWFRLRTWVFAAGLAGLAILPIIILKTSPGAGGGPPFFDLIRNNGLFAGLTAIGLVEPFFLPLGTGLLSGESIAGEASSGTLRYLLARPVGRVRLVMAKYAAVLAQLTVAVVWVMTIGLVSGGLAFGYGDLPTLSGSTLSGAAGLLRVVASAGYVVAAMTGLAAIGVFISTLTDSGPGATVATVFVALLSQILDGLSGIRAIHPYLLTHEWLAFADLFRSPVEWEGIIRGMVLDASYTVVFLGAAILVFARKDVVS
jgi:ABC-2 type transport system permease protein